MPHCYRVTCRYRLIAVFGYCTAWRKDMNKSILSIAMTIAFASATLSVAAHAASAGDPVAGKIAYGACMSCHSIGDNDIGPAHQGVVGRKAGSVPGYSYSIALKNSGIVWTPEKLRPYVHSPQTTIPNIRMSFQGLKNMKDVDDVVAYLQTFK